MLGYILQFTDEKSKPKYIQLYEHIKSEIAKGEINEGQKLPSIRSVADTLAISKSTVEMAYAQLLAEGYIESRAKSGYYVLGIEGLHIYEDLKINSNSDAGSLIQEQMMTDAKKRFNTDGIEEVLFNFNDWRKMTNKILDYSRSSLVKYGDLQGEYSLRVEIAKFVHETRGVVCTPEQIIIGAGVQSLFVLVAALLRGDKNQIAFEFPGFIKGATIFEDYGYETVKIPVKAQGLNISALEKSTAKIVYVSPAHQYPTGSIMPIGNRLKLLKWASENDGIIIEDDYDSVLRYEGLPIPSLQGLNKGQQVVYVGAFSKLLMPSLRISFIILPKNLLEKYVKIKTRYAQTVSKVEQLTLANFMSEGYFDRHIRKIKKAYGRKNQLMLESLRTHGKTYFEVIGKTSGLHVVLSFEATMDVKALAEEMNGIGIRLEDAGLFEGRKIAVLSYSGLVDREIDSAVRAICVAIEKLKRHNEGRT